MVEKHLSLRVAKPDEGAWWKVTYKLPEKYVAGAAAGTIPGFYGSKSAGFFVVAKTLEGAKLGARKMFAEFRKKWGKHAFTLSQEHLLDIKFKRISMHEANHEECLPTILNKAAKVGDPFWDAEYKRLFVVHKILPRGKLGLSPGDNLLPKNYTRVGRDGYCTTYSAIDPENKHDYLLIQPDYMR